MVVLYLLILALLALTSAQTAVPESIQEQWTGTDDDDDGGVPFEYIDEMTPGVDVWPEISTPVGESVSEIPTPSVQLMSGRASEEVKETFAVWKIALVVTVLLVSLVGCLSVAYYFCMWRGGRIYYQAQREGFPSEK